MSIIRIFTKKSKWEEINMGTLIQTFPDGGSGGGASAGMIADEFSTSTVGSIAVSYKVNIQIC